MQSVSAKIATTLLLIGTFCCLNVHSSAQNPKNPAKAPPMKTADNVQQDTAVPDTRPYGKPVASYHKTTCFGKCPSYKVAIYPDGTLTWEGIANTRPLTHKNAKISPETILQLQDKARSIDFLKLDAAYPPDPIADAQATIVYMELDGKTKQVSDIFGAPKGLKELEKMFEDLIKKQGWNKPAPMQRKLENKPNIKAPGAGGGN
jgi:hypothetical protein